MSPINVHPLLPCRVNYPVRPSLTSYLVCEPRVRVPGGPALRCQSPPPVPVPLLGTLRSTAPPLPALRVLAPVDPSPGPVVLFLPCPVVRVPFPHTLHLKLTQQVVQSPCAARPPVSNRQFSPGITPKLRGYPVQGPSVLTVEVFAAMFALQLCKRQDPVPNGRDEVLVFEESCFPHWRHVCRVRD
eukprot:1177852-Prorocentrum_minimum.AAC.1